jgi:asparagine synthase (glutamine-hydrolysing)
VVSRGIKAVLGIDMPLFPKRRFQEGSASGDAAARLFPRNEARYRRHFHSVFAA